MNRMGWVWTLAGGLGLASAATGQDIDHLLQERRAAAGLRPAFIYACDGPVDQAGRWAQAGFHALAAANLELDDRTSQAIAKAGLKLIPDLSLATAASPHPPAERAIRSVALLRQNKLLDSVAWWLVGRALDHGRFEEAAAATAGLLVADAAGRRPVMIEPAEAWDAYAELGAGLLLNEPAFGYGWLGAQPYIARLRELAGRQPYFGVVVQAEWPRHRSADLPGASALADVGPDADQLRWQVFLALQAGAKTVLVPTRSMLARRPVLEDALAEMGLLGCQLRLVEDLLARATPGPPPEVDAREVLAAHFNAGADDLLLLTRTGDTYPYVIDEALAEDFTCTVAVANRFVKAYWVDFPELKPLKTLPVGRHLKVYIPHLDLTGMVLVTANLERAKEIGKTLLAWRGAAVRLAVQAVRHKLDRVTAVVHRLEALAGPPPALAAQLLDSARRKVRSLGENPPADQQGHVYATAREAMRLLRTVQWLHWRRAVGRYSPDRFPYTDHFYALVAHHQLMQVFDPGATAGQPLIEEGFEADLSGQRWQTAGRDVLLEQTVTATLTPAEAHAGRQSLGIRTWDVYRPFGTPVDRPIPASGLCSRPVSIQPGDLLCLRAWVKVPAALERTSRGVVLQVLWADAQGRLFPEQERSAGLVGPMDTWQEVVQYRLADDSRIRSCVVWVGVAGIGKAYVDDLVLSRVGRRPAATAPASP